LTDIAGCKSLPTVTTAKKGENMKTAIEIVIEQRAKG